MRERASWRGKPREAPGHKPAGSSHHIRDGRTRVSCVCMEKHADEKVGTALVLMDNAADSACCCCM